MLFVVRGVRKTINGITREMRKHELAQLECTWDDL